MPFNTDRYWGDVIRELLNKSGKKYTPQEYSEAQNRMYWEKRSEELDKVAKKVEKQVMKEMTDLYAQAFREISKDTNDFLMKYATDNKLDYNTVNQLITPIELSEYNEKMEKLRAMYRDTNSEYILREIKELEARRTITRLQALQDSINIKLCETAHEFQMTLEDVMTGMFTECYKDASEMLGIMSPNIPDEAIKKIIEYPYHGKMFADSVWENKKTLLNHINKNMTIGIIRGDSVQKMARKLRDDLGVSYYQAERLVRTETNYAMNQAHLQGYKDSEVVDQYEILAYIDKRTSKICKQMDRKMFPLSKAQVGVNYPPFHPNCRTTVIPVLEDW